MCDLQLGKCSCVGHLFVVLAELLAGGLEAVEEFSSADGP